MSAKKNTRTATRAPATLDDVVSAIDRLSDRLDARLEQLELHGKHTGRSTVKLERYVRAWFEQLAERAAEEAEEAEAEAAAEKKKKANGASTNA